MPYDDRDDHLSHPMTTTPTSTTYTTPDRQQQKSARRLHCPGAPYTSHAFDS